MEERNEPLFENNLDIAMHHFCQALLELIIAYKTMLSELHHSDQNLQNDQNAHVVSSCHSQMIRVSEKTCYTVQDIQSILGISRGSVYDLLKQKQFKWVKVGNGYRIPRQSFDDWLQSKQ